MDLSPQLALDFRTWDDTESVLFERTLPTGPPDAAGNVVDTGQYAKVDVAKRLDMTARELSASGGAPGATAGVFIDDADFRERWRTADRYYICVEQPQVERLRRLTAPAALYPVAASGGKFVFSNRPVV